MPSKFVSAWKAVGGQVTPSIREIGAMYDLFMPLILVAGPAIGPLGLVMAQAYDAEDDTPGGLYAGRVSPANLFPPQFIPSMVAACGTLTAMFLSTFTPPTPAQALTAWQATPLGALMTSPTAQPGAAQLGAAMAIYLSTAFIGGVGSNPADAPPPPSFRTLSASGLPVKFPPVPVLLSGYISMFQYETYLTPGQSGIAPHGVRCLPIVPLLNPDYDTSLEVWAWKFSSGGTVLGTQTGRVVNFTFSSSTNYDAELTIINPAGKYVETRVVHPD